MNNIRIKAKKSIDKILGFKNSEKLLLNLPFGLKNRFKKVIDIFTINENFFTESCDLKTRANKQSYIRVKCAQNKNNNDKKKIRDRLSETSFSNFNKNKNKKPNEHFRYDINAIKVFEDYNFYSNDKNNPVENIDDHTNYVEYL